jgi:diguanylate cyclase (GGDEF)-like protein
MKRRPPKHLPADATQQMTHSDPLASMLADKREPRACLIIIFGPDIGKKIWLDRPTLVVGRESGSVDAVVSSTKLSRKHFAVLQKENRFWVKDMGSTNGTWVDGRKISREIEMVFGQKIQAGDVIFQFVSEASVEAHLIEKLRQDVFRDALTQVYNKQILPEVEKEIFQKTQKEGRPLGLIMFDIDHFKKLNDGYGHLFGDQVLSTLAKEILGKVVRENEVMIRFGGEEFLMLLPGASRQDCVKVAERIRTQVAAIPFVHQNTPVSVTVSLGIMHWEPESGARYESLNPLIELADQALYRSKQAGRNRVSVFGSP